jgi:hypothetical protein
MTERGKQKELIHKIRRGFIEIEIEPSVFVNRPSRSVIQEVEL